MLFSRTQSILKQFIKTDGLTVQGNSVTFHDITPGTLHKLNNATSYPEWYNSFTNYPTGVYACVVLEGTNKTIIHYLGTNFKSYSKSLVVTHDLFLRGVENPLIRLDNNVKSDITFNAFISYINNKFNYKFYIKNDYLYYENDKIVKYGNYTNALFHVFVAHQLLYYNQFNICNKWTKSTNVDGFDLTAKDAVFTRTKKVPTYIISKHPIFRTLDQYEVDSQLIKLFNGTLSSL